MVQEYNRLETNQVFHLFASSKETQEIENRLCIVEIHWKRTHNKRHQCLQTLYQNRSLSRNHWSYWSKIKLSKPIAMANVLNFIWTCFLCNE